MNEHKLSGRYKRLLASMLFVVEKKIDDIESLINKKPEHATYRILIDIDQDKLNSIRASLVNARDKIGFMVNKYHIKKREIHASSYTPTIESQMWEMITDSLSRSMKGYGKDIVEEAKLVDQDISDLMSIIETFRNRF